MVAAEDVERQVAVAVVIAMEEAALLAPVQGVVGGVEVQHQPLRRLRVGLQEKIDQQRLDRLGVVADAAIAMRPRRRVLQPVQGRFARQRRAMAMMRLHRAQKQRPGIRGQRAPRKSATRSHPFRRAKRIGFGIHSAGIGEFLCNRVRFCCRSIFPHAEPRCAYRSREMEARSPCAPRGGGGAPVRYSRKAGRARRTPVRRPRGRPGRRNPAPSAYRPGRPRSGGPPPRPSGA